MAGLSLGLGIGLSGNGNRAPGISFSGSIAEGATTGRAVGTATLANPPVGIGTLTWSELGTGTGAALFAINSSTGAVTNSSALDYETATSYTYGIQVTDGVYTYERMATISVTNVTAVPDAPSLTATAGNGEVTLSWTDATLPAEATTIASHKLYRGTVSGSLTLLGTIMTGSPYVDTGLTNGTAYYYKLSAVNSVGESALSTEQSATPSAVTGPVLTIPTDVAASATVATIGVTTDTANGMLYWYVSASSTPPSAANLKSGSGAVKYGSQVVTATGAQSATPINLTAATAYYTHFIQTDSSSVDSSIVSADGFTTDAAPTAKILIGVGDSTIVGVNPRDAGDNAWTNTYNWRTRTTAGIATSLPYDQAIAPSGTDYLSHLEYSAKRYVELYPSNKIMVVPHGQNGSKIVGTGALWGVGNVLHEAIVTRANAAIAGWLAANPSDVLEYEISVSESTNDAASDVDAFEAAWIAAIADLRSRIFKNGVSGATIGTGAVTVFRGALAETRYLDRNYLEQRLRKMMYNVPNARYWLQAEGQSADAVHTNNAGNRLDGVGCENVCYESAAPVITLANFSIYSGQKLAREIVSDKWAWFTLSGADAAQFEVAIIPELNTAGNVLSSRDHWYLRWTGNGDAPAAGTYNVTIHAWGNGGKGTKDLTVTVAAAYGTVAETITTTYGNLWNSGTPTPNAYGHPIYTSMALKRGVNQIIFLKASGTATAVTALVASNGLVGVADANNTTSSWQYFIYSAQDETVNIEVTANGTIGTSAMLSVATVGTTATPASTSVMALASRSSPHQTASLTCPTNGVIVGGGNANGYSAPVSGMTALVAPPGPPVVGYRTTTGTIGGAGTTGNSWLAAAAWNKA